MTNPLLQKSNLKDGAMPFDQIRVEHFIPAIEAGIQAAKTNIEKIKTNPEPANFNNTIEALEQASEQLEYVSGIYFNLFSAEASEAHQALAKDISPKMAAFSSDVNLDPELFSRVKTVFDKRETLGLTGEQSRLLKKFYTDFVRNGALLSEADKEKLRKIDQELSVLSPKFSENVLKATNAYELWIENEKDLSGLPEGAIEAAHAAAEHKGKKGQWLFTLQFPSYLPFIQYADNRELREKLWKAANSKAFKNEFDNQETILKTVTLKNQRAQLLGFKTHANFVLEERMAQTPEQVFTFIHRLLGPSMAAGQKELQELKAFKKEMSGSDDLQPWDTAYYSEKLKEKKFHFNEEELRPYFKLENVIEGVFEHARRLYGLVFKPITDVPVYHPDVKTYEVRDEKTNEYISLFYADFFPRETKKGGAWMTSYREQGVMFGTKTRPHVSIVCNFTKPTPTKPSLISYDEVRTLFHEFGHALHGMLSNVTYRSVSGTNVYWDFVELPSQIMENWVQEQESLDLFAKHYVTNEKIPHTLVEKIKAASQFQAGMASLRQLQFALMDMKWHTTPPETIKDVDAFETEATSSTRLLPKVPGTNTSCSFSHIFAGGYSAGYYSYKWAEVLDADAFEYFKEMGIFSKDVANKFKDNILSKGGTEHPMELYKKFRGREPDPNSLLKRDGLL